MIRRNIGRSLFVLFMMGSVAVGSAQALGIQSGAKQYENGCEYCALCHPVLGGKRDGITGVCIWCCQVQ